MVIDLSPTRTRRTVEPADRDALVRAFTAWTGDPSIADDLAQETLYAAWISSRQPGVAGEWRPWLFGVARNILLRWRREQAKHGRRVASAPESEYHLLAAAADDDIEALLSRKDIVELLDAALGRLPKETRQALLLKYIDDLPQSEVAEQMGLHEKALEGRLHRGKRAMHRYLITEQADSAVSLGLVSEPDTWIQTDIWCPMCGKAHLHGRWYDTGCLRLDCPSCDNWFRPGERLHFFSTGEAHQGVPPLFPLDRRPSFRVAMERVSDAYHRTFNRGLDSVYKCPRCGGTVHPSVINNPDDPEGIHGPEVRYDCSSCGYSGGHSFVPGSEFRHPTIIQWTERHERIRMLPPRFIQVNGRPSVEAEWESVSGTGSAVTIHDLTSLMLIRAICDGVVVMKGEPA